MIRRFLIGAAFLSLSQGLAGCQTTLPTSAASVQQAVAAGAPQAYYDSLPEHLFFAHEQVCRNPGEEFLRPSRTEIRCEMLLPPDATGALILRYDGSVEDLPKVAMAFVAQAAAQGGYVVTADNYIRIPQRSGGTRLIRLPDPELRKSMEELLTITGGRLL